MNRYLRTGLAAGAAVLLPIGFVGVADAATDPVFDLTLVDAALPGAAFIVNGNVNGDVRPELVATAFGPYAGPAPAGAGTVTLYNNTAKNKQGGDIDSWAPTTIVPQSAGIYGPNQPTLSDVDGDGDVDVILPGGNFFKSTFSTLGPPFSNVGSGTLSWWENRANGSTWIGHDIVADSTFTGPSTAPFDPDGPGPAPAIPGTTQRNYSYHGVEHVDFDGDGIKDLVTVGEDGGNPSDATDDLTQLQYLPGLGGGNFGAPVDLGPGGGSLPVVDDVNGDGDLDVVSAQFFGAVQGQPFIPPFARTPASSSYVWFDRTGTAADGLDASDFTPRIIGAAQGPGFSIQKVENLRGDGIDRWVATNHTNDKVPFPPFSLQPKPNVYEFTPGANPTQPWSVVQLTQDGDISITGPPPSNPGQAAPGVTSPGDLDGDGDIDLAVSGDGDRQVFWLEQVSPGSFELNQLPGGTGWGQAGATAGDLNRDGVAEMAFASFDKSQVGIWQS